ncbi:YncE family protein [Amycolatopsis sp. GM8]|uniref:YncE family protein n=1 Tax=Amycolatopsis sp. GM8 TaxID=2896530 RepID=UPI001F35E29B|nr:YncE family protein [Amycolatopsis sp. GM8]
MSAPTALLAVASINEHKLTLHTVEADGSISGEPTVVDLSAVPGDPHEVRYDPRRRHLYVSHTYLGGWYFDNNGPDHHISIVDVDSRSLAGLIDLSDGPRTAHGIHDLWVDTARDRIWGCVEAGVDSPGGLIGIDPDTGDIVSHIDAEVRAAHWFALTPDGAYAYTANKEAPYVSVLDLDAEKLTARIPVPGSEGIAAGLDGRVFVAGPCVLPGAPAGPAGVRVIDGASHEITALLEMEFPSGAVHVTAGGLLLATEIRTAMGTGESTEGMLKIWSAGTLEPVGETPVGGMVLTMTSSPDGRLAFVSDSHSGTVAVIDLRTCERVSTLTGISAAHGMAVVPAT